MFFVPGSRPMTIPWIRDDILWRHRGLWCSVCDLRLDAVTREDVIRFATRFAVVEQWSKKRVCCDKSSASAIG